MGRFRNLTPDLSPMTRADKAAVWAIVGLLSLIAGAIPLLSAISRIVVLTRGTDVPLEIDTYQQPALELGSAVTEAHATSANVVVAQLMGRERALLIASEVVGTLGWLVTIACVIALIASIARGVAFSRGNAWAMYLAAIAMILGYGGGQLFDIFGRGEVAIRLGEGVTFALTLDSMQLLVIPVVFVALAVVLGAGARMQKDTEGLA